MRIKQSIVSLIVMISCTTIMAAAHGANSSGGQPPGTEAASSALPNAKAGGLEGNNVTVGGNEPTEEQKSVLNDLLQELAQNSSITGEVVSKWA